MTKRDINGQVSNDFDVLEVEDFIEEDVEGRVNDIKNHLCVYSSSEEGSESKQDGSLRFTEPQQETIEDDSYRNELIALFSDNSDKLHIP